jgi:hypothetical protein
MSDGVVMRCGTSNGGLPDRTNRAHSRINVRAPGAPKNGLGTNPRTRATTGTLTPRNSTGRPPRGYDRKCGTEAPTVTNPSLGGWCSS